jgi:hypothetical protein
LFLAYGFSGITTQWVSRTLQSGKMPHDTAIAIRPLVLKIENLIQRAEPFPVSFENIELVQNLLDAIGEGVDLSTRASLMPFYQSDNGGRKQ